MKKVTRLLNECLVVCVTPPSEMKNVTRQLIERFLCVCFSRVKCKMSLGF